MSKVSDVLEILRRSHIWRDSLAHHTTIYPDGLGSSYWPIRRWSAVGTRERGVLWIWPEPGFHGAWYLLSAWAAALQGFHVYLPERSGAGIHPARQRVDERDEQSLLKTLLPEWHPDLESSEWVPKWEGDLVSETALEPLRAFLLEVDSCLGHESAPSELLVRRLMSERCAERLAVDLGVF